MSHEEQKNALLAERLRHIRTQLGWSLRDLEQKSGVANSTISLIESGKRGVRMATLQKLARALGVSVAYLIGQTDEDYGIDPTTGRRWKRVDLSGDPRQLADLAGKVNGLHTSQMTHSIEEAIHVLDRIRQLLQQKEQIERKIKQLIEESKSAQGWRLEINERGELTGITIDIPGDAEEDRGGGERQY